MSNFYQYQRATSGNYSEVKVLGEWMEETKALANHGSEAFQNLDEVELPEWADRIEIVKAD